MLFCIEHTFENVSLVQFSSLYFDNAFNAALCTEVELAREVLEEEVTETHLKRVTKVGAERELPAAAQKVLGVERIGYLEEVVYERATHRGTWKTTPSVMADKVNTGGTFYFEERTHSVFRRVDGEIAVNLFGIGGAVEKVIVADIERGYEKGALFMQKWINEHLSAT